MSKHHTPLFRRDFTLVVIGQIISLFGNAILRFALPLYLLRQTGSPALFGAVGAAAFRALASNWGWSRVSRERGSIMATAFFSSIIPSSTRSQAIFRAAWAVRLPLRHWSI